MDDKQIFFNNVHRIIIESYNLCNRKCYMCPQSLGIRSETYQEFSEELFLKLLDELCAINYSRCIAFGRYHEPLLFSDITLRRVEQVKQILPNAQVVLNTNGDYLTREMLFQLSDKGVDELKVMRYQGVNYSVERAKKMCDDMIESLGLNVSEKILQEDIIVKYELKSIGNMKITIKSENYNNPERGCDRGGLIKGLESYDRKYRCDVPIKNIDIDYNGNVMPCNNLLSDAKSHEQYILGNLRDITIFEAYRKGLKSCFVKRIYQGDFSQDAVCQHCSYFYDTSSEQVKYILE